MQTFSVFVPKKIYLIFYHLIKEIVHIQHVCIPSGPFVSLYFLQDPFLGGNCLCAGSISEMVFLWSVTCGYLCRELKFQVVGGEAARPIGREICSGHLQVTAHFSTVPPGR